MIRTVEYHDWRYYGLVDSECCINCGIMQNQQNKRAATCKGTVKVTLRETAATESGNTE